MKTPIHSFLAAGFAFVALVACHSVQQVSAADSSVRITSEQEFRGHVIGKKLVNKGGHVVVHEDGTLSGEFKKKKITGTWSWEDQYYCRTGKLGGKDFGHDCQVVEVSGNTMIFKGNKGKRKKGASYQIESES